MTGPEFVYVVVIAKPPADVWKGLTNPEFTRQYWHKTEVRSDFAVGSAIEFLTEDGHVGCEGEILCADYPSKLAYSWQFPGNPETAKEPHSRVTFQLEAIKAGTKLTVIHDQFPARSKMYDLVKPGWPLVICGLKTLLESGTAVDFSAGT